VAIEAEKPLRRAAAMVPTKKPDPIKDALDKARADYQAETEKLHKRLLESLDKEDDRAHKAGNIDAVEQIKDQRAAFEKDGTLPTVVSTKDYQQEMKKARETLLRAYEAAVGDYTKARMDDQAEAVKNERKGFEANAAPATADEQAIQRAVDRGVAHLKGLQQPDGTWRYPEIGATALCGLALLESGVKADDPAVQKAARAVREQSIGLTKTYSLSLGIMFLDRLGDPADAELIDSMAIRLLAGQNANSGGWSYECPPLAASEAQRLREALQQRPQRVAQPAPQGRGTVQELPKEIQQQLRLVNQQQAARAAGAPVPTDNSNTQFAALALWIAHRRGIPIETALKRLESRFRSTQQPDGGWCYNPQAGKGGPPATTSTTPTMTCAGLLGLAVSLTGSPARAQGAVKEPAVAKALHFLGEKMAEPAKGNPSGAAKEAGDALGGVESGRVLYFLWDLERVCLIYDLKTVEKRDWYAWGARWLLDHQKEDGSWKGEFAEAGSDTCFALLFLGRSNLTADLTRRLK
jgi:hypothetical protein